MKLKLLIIYCLLLTLSTSQTIQFSVYVESELTATNESDFSFGSFNLSGDGLVTVALGDLGMGKLSIAGNSDLDVIVSLDVPATLTHTGASSNAIPITLQFAYANNNIDDYSSATIVSSGTTARFKIKARNSGEPPSAPPDPSIRKSATISADATAYIYIFGTCTINSIDLGTYTGTVTLSVNYD